MPSCSVRLRLVRSVLVLSFLILFFLVQPILVRALPAHVHRQGAAGLVEIALKDAGVSAADATFLHAHLDRDDRVIDYDVEFYHDGKEYDYEINAYTGDILEKSVEREPAPKIVTQPPAVDAAPQVDAAPPAATQSSNITYYYDDDYYDDDWDDRYDDDWDDRYDDWDDRYDDDDDWDDDWED